MKMKQQPIDQCFCQSYYNDDGILQDCTCGKCKQRIEEWEETFDNKFHTKISQENGLCSCEDIKSFIRSELQKARKESYEKGYVKGISKAAQKFFTILMVDGGVAE